jgi:hypothetical protein
MADSPTLRDQTPRRFTASRSMALAPPWSSIMSMSRPYASSKPMTSLILKRAKFSRPSGQWQDEDYDVLADGKVVGRILESGSRFDPPDLLWTWSITSIWPATRGVTNGTAATREESMGKFRAAWDKAKA